jgi:hypothetical protein
MKKMVSREGEALKSCIVFVISLLVFIPMVLADEGIEGGGGEGWLSRVIGKIKNPFGNFGGLFSELSPADVGHKPRVKPHLNFNQGFVSNARLGEHQADAAWQARVSPGITVTIPSGKLYSEMDYTYSFSTTQGRRTNANVNGHNLSALARYEVSADTVVGVGNNIQLSEVPGEGGDTFIVETATTQLRHRLSPKLSSEIHDTFQWFKDQTETSPFNSRRGGGSAPFARNKEFNNEFVDNGVGVSLGYAATADLSVGPTFAWNVRNFVHATGKNYWQIQPQVSASYQLGPKTKLSGDFGWALRKFTKKSSTTEGDRTESELVYAVSANHLYGRKLVWSVSYSKTLQDTFDTSFVLKDTPVATPQDNLDRDFRVIKSHRIGTQATYNFNERNSFGVFGDFSFIDGDAKDNIIAGTKNDEKLAELGARYTYRFNRYITFDVLYSFGRRFSGDNPTTSGRPDYTFHRVTGGVNLTV